MASTSKSAGASKGARRPPAAAASPRAKKAAAAADDGGSAASGAPTRAKPAAKAKGAGTAKAAAKPTSKARPAAARAAKASTGAPKRPATAAKAAARKAGGKQLVIVESPAKAKTINKYLGPDYHVLPSVGHIRDLPNRAPKGTKQPVPGVDLDQDFRPTYEVLERASKTVAELKRTAKGASDIWFATDLDREGEAIAWHLAEVLGVEPTSAKRVVFNAITKAEVERAFAHPRPIDLDKVNAQQARRILDRIVGYQVSPLLWNRVARGLSAGRVQSVAVRLVVDREREIRGFVPDESWKVTVRLALEPARAAALMGQWRGFADARDDKGKGPTVKAQNAWLAEHAALRTELVQLDGQRFELGCPADDPKDLSAEVVRVGKAAGLATASVRTVEDPKGRGPARYVRTAEGEVDPAARYRVTAVETKRTRTKPPPPFITSSLQIAASTYLGFGAQRTMRIAQQLYEGVDIPGEGQVGLITYMRTDSTHLSSDALGMARGYIGDTFGPAYLPASANVYSSANKDAQEAHEAIRPTDVRRTPDQLERALTEEQLKLYKLIWSRFVGGQMTPSEWDSTSVSLERSDRKTGAVVRVSGRVLAFDGFHRVTGVPTASDEQTLPALKEGDVLAPFAVEPEQKFGAPPPRYTEASLVKMLEAEGIGRPSTYASIIQVIQDRKYVEQVDRRFHATDLGEVVTDKLIEAFPDLMDVGYTRQMERGLDEVEERHADWVEMLHRFYSPFTQRLEAAYDKLTHAKAEIQVAPYACPKCGSRTAYRFGKNGRFLSCTAYPECDYAAPIDREGRPVLPERVDLANPDDGSAMEVRTGRFGSFLASVNYPATKFVLNLDKKGGIKYPARPPLVVDAVQCPKCGSPLNLRRGAKGPWLGCSKFPKCRGRVAWSSVDDGLKAEFERALVEHERANPQPKIVRHSDGTPVPEGTPIEQLLIPGGLQELPIHPDAHKDDGADIRWNDTRRGGSGAAVRA